MLREQRGDFERDLSPHWAGRPARRQVLSRLPVWIAFALAGVLGLELALGERKPVEAEGEW